MGHHKTISGSTPNTVPSSPLTYHVTGNLTPDITDNFICQGSFGGKLYFKWSGPTLFFLYWYNNSWELAPDEVPNDEWYWKRNDPSPFGEYIPDPENATGIATVVEGPE